MFIWDFLLGTVMDQFIDWIYGQVIGFLGDFFAQMGNMGVELFEMDWVASIVLLFSYLAWALYGTGLVVAAFETGIEYQHGRGSIRDTALNVIKGFMAVSLFTIAPVELFKLSVNLQSSLTAGITGYGQSFGEMANGIIAGLGTTTDLTGGMAAGVFGGLSAITSPIMLLFMIIMMGYAVIKVFFANLKRGGILLIQIAVGSLYMFSIPRGYTDGFVQWCKQIIGSIIVSVLTVVIGVFLASLAGYAYVMYKNKTMNRLFSLSFFSIMIPSSVIVIPLFMMLRFMNLLDSLFSVILVSLSLPFLIYLFRQNTKMFPRELIKIARVDGLSEFSIYWRIYLPNMKAVFVTASLILFIDTWNSLLYPLVIIQSQKNMMLSVYINSIGSSRTSDYGAFMIALLISTIPILILFVAVQKQFRSGMRTM